MSFHITCPDCQTTYNLADRIGGQKVRCKKCQAVFVATPGPAQKPEGAVRPAAVKAASPDRRDAAEERLRDSNPEVQPAKKGKGRAGGKGSGGNVLLWVFLGLVGFVVVFVVGPVVGFLAYQGDLFTGSPSASRPDVVPPMPGGMAGFPGGPPGQPLQEAPADLLASLPVQAPVRFPVQPAVPPSATPEAPGPRPAGLTREAVEAVKRATVYVRVTMPDDSEASGTGFFGAADAPNIVLTNAHVVGMLAPDSKPPKKVEVVVNSGQAGERRLTAKVAGVDRGSDLALLDVGRADPAALPKPLVVKSAGGLRELEKVYIFGFPLGERLGKEITVRDSTVASLRKQYGALHRVQVSGGMDEGNSGGPVVDGFGHVVGVAVSGIRGRQINFAIPADYARALLAGRVTAVTVGQPYEQDGQVGVPVAVEMIDPRRQVRSVAVEVWAGPEGSGYRPAAAEQPGTEPGDSPHRRVTLKHDPASGQFRGEALLPAPEEGKVYWVQPCCASQEGGMGWSSAAAFRPAGQPAERRPAELRARLQPEASGNLSVTLESRLRAGADEESELGGTRTAVVLREQVVQANPGSGAVIRLFYEMARMNLVQGKETRPSDLWETVRPYLGQYIIGVIESDASGNLKKNDIDRERVDQLFNIPEGPGLLTVLSTFHDPVRYTLDTMAVPLPNRQVSPGEHWQAERSVPTPGPHSGKAAKSRLTYTYLGRRNREGRDEAVVGIRGTVPAVADVHQGGKVRGTALVDLATGQVTAGAAEVVLDVAITVGELGAPPHEVQVQATLDVRLQRSPKDK